MSLPQYPEYKDSGHPHISKVPSQWEIKPLKHCLRLITDKAAGKSSPIALENIEGWSARYLPSESDFEGVGIAFRQGDILFGKLRPYLAKVYQAEFAGEAIGDFHAMRPVAGLIGRYALYQFLQESFISVVDGATHGAKMPRVGWEFMGNMPFVVPRPEEQLHIARFLSHETAKIDALIREQERLIELLQEKRQAVISHAVTKGVDPDVPMKDSGVEWLGEVPAHWEMVPLKHLCSFSGGGTPSKEKLEYWNGDIPWVSPKDMKSFWVSNSIDKITELAVVESSTSLVEPNALLMVVRSGILQRTIPVAINTVEVTLNQDMKALRFSMEGFERYFAMLVQGFEPSWLLEWRKQGATVESIEQEYLAESLIPVPPRDEMYAIVNKLAAVAKQYESLEDEAHKSSKLLRERRSALISAAVTGKIDVRNWQPPTDESAFDEEVPQAGMETTA